MLHVPIRLTRSQQLFHEQTHRTNYDMNAVMRKLVRNNYNSNFCDIDTELNNNKEV